MVAQMTVEEYTVQMYSCRIFIYLNHAVNPILYNFVSPILRTSLLIAFCKSRTHSCVNGSIHKQAASSVSSANTQYAAQQKKIMMSKAKLQFLDHVVL
jgi:hypothetical protein